MAAFAALAAPVLHAIEVVVRHRGAIGAGGFRKGPGNSGAGAVFSRASKNVDYFQENNLGLWVVNRSCRVSWARL